MYRFLRIHQEPGFAAMVVGECSDLNNFSPDRVMALLADGVIEWVGAAPEPVQPVAAEAQKPLALSHHVGPPPYRPGTWEAVWEAEEKAARQMGRGRRNNEGDDNG